MNYGIPQSRNRCIAVSILGDYTFEFPQTVPLDTVMADFLETDVDEKYYLTSDKAKDLIDRLILDGKIPLEEPATTMPTVNELGFVERGSGKHQSNTVYDANAISPTLTAVSYRDPVKVVVCQESN